MGYPENIGYEPAGGFDPETGRPITTEDLKRHSESQTKGRDSLWEEARKRWIEAQNKKHSLNRTIGNPFSELLEIKERMPRTPLEGAAELASGLVGLVFNEQDNREYHGPWNPRFWESPRERMSRRIPKDALRQHYSPEMEERLSGLDSESRDFLLKQHHNAEVSRK